jgi:hypothetical protein
MCAPTDAAARGEIDTGSALPDRVPRAFRLSMRNGAEESRGLVRGERLPLIDHPAGGGRDEEDDRDEGGGEMQEEEERAQEPVNCTSTA